jgi:bacterial/archaeal transporter family-2 protein
MQAVPLILAILAGALTAMQAPTNALLGKAGGSPILAALISFLVGSAALAAYVLLSATRVTVADFRGLPWYAWIGGLYGAFFVAVAAFAAPRLGVGVLLTAVIAGQLAAAMLLDHFGLIGLETRPVNLTRLAGMALVLAGAILVWRS